MSSPVWSSDTAWSPLPALSGELEADVCVVGLGGSGLSCIGELRRRGARVVGIDAGQVGGCAAGRNGGFLLAGLAAFHHHAAEVLGRERAARLYRLTLAEMDRIVAETPEHVRRVGSLRVAASPEERLDCDRQLAAMRADGLPAEPYEGPEGSGLLIPTDGSFQPLARCHTLARRALAAGARLFESSPAVEITQGRVRTPAGSISCSHVVVAVDGRLDVVMPQLAGRLRTARLQMLATAPAPEVRFARPVYSRWGYDYWQQLPDGRVALGGARDIGGDAEWTHDAEPTAPVQAALDRLLRERLRVHAEVTHRWAASVSYTHDGLPVVEQVRSRVWAAGGYSGTGNVIGALITRGIAEQIATGRSEVVEAFAGR